MIPEAFFDVFTPIALLYAVASGTLLGSTVLVYLTLRRPPLTFLPPHKAVLLAVGVLWLLGTTFFAGQISQAFVEAPLDANTPRIIARYALWLVFSVAVAVSHTWAVSFARRERHHR